MIEDLLLRLRALFRPSAVDSEIDEELRSHAERLEQEYARQGFSRAEAARRARLDFGGLGQTKDAYRDALGVRSIETTLFDLRLAVKRLRKDARVSGAVVLALGLGIGAATVAAGLFDNLLRSPFPYVNADRLITFSIRNLTANGATVGRSFFTPPELRAFREQSRSLEDFVATAGPRRVIVQAGGRNVLVPSGAYVTANAFGFYGVAPFIGRGIEPRDGEPGAEPVFAVGYHAWQEAFGGNPDVVGRTFTVDGIQRTLVGVMPPRFRPGGGSLWMPADLSAGTYGIVARMQAGASIAGTAAELDAIAHRFTKDEPGFVLNPAQFAVRVTPLADAALGGFKAALYALLAAASMLLLIACANAANLLLARATAREREMAVCAALGAGPARLVRQLLAEGLVLSLAGCGLGCAAAWAGLKLVSAAIPRDTIPGEAAIALNAFALGSAVALSALTALICGLAPALHAVAPDLHRKLTGAAKGERASVSGRGVRAGLVVAEVSLSMVLLVGATLTLRSFLALTHEPLPFEPSATLYATVLLPRDYYVKPDRKPAFFEDVLTRIKSLPGVADAAESLMLPPDEGSWTDIAIPGKPHVERWTTDMELCTEGYFRTLGIQLVKGRLLTDLDVKERRFVAVVNQSLARTYFGTDDPIGQTIKFEVLDRPFVDAPHNTYFEVVGVAADFRTRPGRVRYTLRPTAYLPASVAAFGQPLQILAKTSVDPHALVPAISRSVLDVEPRALLSASGSIADALDEEFRAPRFEFLMVGAFGAAGLALAAIGVFSVMAYAVSLQHYEIGLRLALGAEPAAILRAVFANGAMLVAVGVGIGLTASVTLVRLIESLLWGVAPTDPLAFTGAVTVIAAVGSVACLLPALRAARLDPLIVLRSE